MGIDYTAIGKRIKLKRRVQRKTQDDIAERLGVSVGYISQIERGITRVSLPMLSRLAGCLNCDIIELINGSQVNRPEYLDSELSEITSRMSASQKRLLIRIAAEIAKEQTEE